MTLYEPKPGMYDYRYLPAFAQFLLDNHLEEFTADQLKISRALNLPLLKHLEHLTDEQIITFGKDTSREFLEFIARNDARRQIIHSMQRWLNDKLDIIGKYEVNPSDITTLNYIRGKVLKKSLRDYDIPVEDKYELIDEIDSFLFGSITSATNTFIEILSKKVNEDTHFTTELINTSPGIIFIFDVEKNKEVYVNGNVQDVMGYTSDEVLNMESNLISMLIHHDDINTLQKHFEEILQDKEGKAYQAEYRFKHKNGNYKWLRTYDVVFKRNESGYPLELLGTSFEVTREKETSFALEKRENQLLEAQAIAQIGSFEWDMINDHTVYTPQLQKILGFDGVPSKAELLHNVNPDDVEKLEKAWFESMATGKFDCQYRFLVSGKQKVLWTRGIVSYHGGAPAFMRGTIQDITELKEIEDELLRKTRELERSNESLAQFASIASHDLKEPLRKMSMYTDMAITMEENNLSEGSRVNLEKVKNSAIRMQNMIDDILKFSTITKEEKKENVNLKSIITEVRLILEELINEKHAAIITDDLPDLMMIPSQMRQLFQNLISNAIKFSKAGEKPEIIINHKYIRRRELKDAATQVQHAESYLQIKVSDNGIGFKQEHAEKIFGLFTRLHGRAVFEGTGLGLSICKRIAENHGGTISARSSPGRGATFIITLPISGEIKNPAVNGV
jgi:PAS domain S-box-containing protein